MFFFNKRKEGFINSTTNKPYPNCHLGTWYPHQVYLNIILFLFNLFKKILSKLLKKY